MTQYRGSQAYLKHNSLCIYDIIAVWQEIYKKTADKTRRFTSNTLLL